jgi:hypothetical protein
MLAVTPGLVGSIGNNGGSGTAGPPQAAPANTVAPVASGSTTVGSTLTTTDGTWTGNPPPSFGYQWRRAGVDIGGAIASTYVTQPADVGSVVTCRVTATNVVGSASADSNAITPVAIAPANTVAPVVSGSAPVGSTLTTTDGTWTGAPSPTFTYQWKRAGGNIGGATSVTYVTVTADAGQAITCTVTGTNVAGNASAGSNTLTPTAAPVNTAAPVVSGSAPVGSTLTTTDGTWTGYPTPTYTYQWRRAGVAISGETASTYVTQAADIGLAVDCVVTGTSAAGSASAASSTSVTVTAAPAAPVNTVAPAVTGTVRVGLIATCSTGTWTGFPTPTYAYQWKRGGIDIGGETASTYTYALADLATNITCSVTATNVSGSATAGSNTIAVGNNPYVITQKTVGWWTADAGVTQSAGAVSAWADQVAGISFTQATGANQPTYSATGWNGAAPGVTYPSGGAAYMSTANVPASWPTGAAASELWSVFDNISLGSDGDVSRDMISYGNSNGALRSLRRASVSNVNRLRATDNVVTASNTTVDISGRHYGRGSWDGTLEGVAADGSALTTVALVPATATTRIRTGNTPVTVASGFEGVIRDMFALNAVPSAGEITALNAYCASRI